MNNGLKVLKHFQCARLQKSRQFFISYVSASAFSLDAIVRLFMMKEDGRQNQWGI